MLLFLVSVLFSCLHLFFFYVEFSSCQNVVVFSVRFVLLSLRSFILPLLVSVSLLRLSFLCLPKEKKEAGGVGVVGVGVLGVGGGCVCVCVGGGGGNLSWDGHAPEKGIFHVKSINVIFSTKEKEIPISRKS